MKKRLCGKSFVYVLCAFLMIPPLVSAGTVYVENMAFAIDSFQYFTSGTTFGINYNGVGTVSAGTLQTFGGGYNYTIEDITVSWSSCAYLGENNLGGGQASGAFSGGATFTLTGSMSVGGTEILPVGTTLLVAQMDPSITSWNLTETSPVTNTLSGGGQFSPASGALVSGVAGNGNIVKIGNIDIKLGLYTPFYFNKSGQMIMTGLTSFDNILMAGATGPTIQINSVVPEPATLILLGMGGVCLLRKK